MTYLHNLDPFAIHFTGDIGIRWYGLAYLSGFFLSFYLISWFARRKKIRLPLEKVGDFVFYVAFGTMLGGRFGYALFYKPELFLEFSASFPFWGFLEVHKGGMASHGGFLGIVVACWLFSRKHKVSIFELVDLTLVGGTVGIIFGRIANFINGELYGRVVEGTTWWAVQFPAEMYLWLEKGLKPQLESFYKVVEVIKPLKTNSGELNPTLEEWTKWVARGSSASYRKIEPFISESIVRVQAGSAEVSAALSEVLSLRYPSQLYQAFFEGFLLLVVIVLYWRLPKKPGYLAGVWGICYSIARIFGEGFRLPDSHLGFQALGLTRGQWLSVGFFVFALGFWYFASKQDNEKIAGWQR